MNLVNVNENQLDKNHGEYSRVYVEYTTAWFFKNIYSEK